MNRVNWRYIDVIGFLLAMTYIHLYIILIHPLLFIVWPLCLWFLFEIYQRWENDPRLLVFGVCLVGYIVVTQLLVVETGVGIFFDQEQFPNMSMLSEAVLVIATIVYLGDVFLLKKDVKSVTLPYVGFASVIPWIGPAIIEGIILIRWSLENSFISNTLGKGIGAASLDDILFTYGFRNFTAAAVVSVIVISVQSFWFMFRERRKRIDERQQMEMENNEWLRNAWENPISLLSNDAKISFEENYGYLPTEEQKRILREKILPEKGINLIDPDS